MPKRCKKTSLQPSLLQAEQPQLSQPFLTAEVLQPPDQFCGPTLDLLRQVHVFPVLRALELDTGLQVGSHQSRAEQRDRIPSLALLVTLISNHEASFPAMQHWA